MNHTILYATAPNSTNILDLSKNGNCYSVCVWDAAQHCSLRRCSTTTLKDAREVFNEWAQSYDLPVVHETRPDFDATDFD